MADEKLTGLPTTASAAADDQIYIVDVSDTTDDPAGSSKSIEVAALLSGTADASHTHTKSEVTDFGVVAADVDTEAATDGQVLTSDGAGNAAWETVSGGGASALDDLTDVTITTPSSTQVLTYDGAGWVNDDAPAGGATGAGANKILLEEITLTTAGEFDFDNIPGDYDRLIIEYIDLRSSGGSTLDGVRLYYNDNLTDANYRLQQLNSSGGSVSSNQFSIADIGVCPASGSTAGYVANGEVFIPNYAGSSPKTAIGIGSAQHTATQITSDRNVNISTETGPVTRVRIRTDNHPTDGLTGTLRLYGERSITIEDSETITTKKQVPVTLTAGEFTIDLTNYQDGDRVVLEGSVQSAASGVTIDEIEILINGDTNVANYRHQIIVGNSGSVQNLEAASPTIMWAPAGSSGTRHNSFRIQVDDYAASGKIKSVMGSYASIRTDSAAHVGMAVVGHDTDTAAITSLTLKADGGEDLSGTVKAYIEKEGVIAATPVTGGLIEIESITDPVSGEFDFTGIPQAYKRLVLKGSITDTTEGYLYIEANGDTTAANYDAGMYQLYTGTGFHSQHNDNRIGYVGNLANNPTKVDIQVEDYTHPTDEKIVAGATRGRVASGNMVIQDTATASSVTSAITSLTVTGASSLSGTLTLYGEL